MYLLVILQPKSSAEHGCLTPLDTSHISYSGGCSVSEGEGGNKVLCTTYVSSVILICPYSNVWACEAMSSITQESFNATACVSFMNILQAEEVIYSIWKKITKLLVKQNYPRVVQYGGKPHTQYNSVFNHTTWKLWQTVHREAIGSSSNFPLFILPSLCMVQKKSQNLISGILRCNAQRELHMAKVICEQSEERSTEPYMN